MSKTARFGLLFGAAACSLLWLTAPLAAQPVSSGAVQAPDPALVEWLRGLAAEAQARGVSPAVFEEALGDFAPIDRVIELDRKQPEFTLSFWRYIGTAVSDARVERGRALLEQHGELLEAVARRYGVQPRFLVAFWGLETNYGETFGNFPVVEALATLAFDTRRSQFFRRELLTALEILQEGDIEAERMEGSWAGAMGHLQFMPSTFAGYAVDADKDGRRDIWRSLPDVFASAANYLKALGWDSSKTWGREVVLPKDFDWHLVSIATEPETRKPLTQWAELGVRLPGGGPLPRADIEAAVILPAGASGPAFLVYDNYRRILRWNRSILYAVAVGHLADRLIGGDPLSLPRPSGDDRVSYDQVREIQTLLGELGYLAGEPDGQVGPLTRAAIRRYQLASGLPGDALPSAALLDRLRATVTR